MSPVELQGNNLGERHKYFNTLVKDANRQSIGTDEPTEPNINDSDISNLINIDVANANENVQFILKTLTCSDLLYVTRAIKKCDWLINDEKYAHIINPEYLDVNLYPRMQTKAVSKLKKLILLKLKNELRAEQFYNYETKSSDAIKWLHKCSIEFIEKKFSEHADEMNISLLKRLCERSILFLEKYVVFRTYVSSDAFQRTLFLLHVNVEQYLDIIESQPLYLQPNFGKRATKVLMTKCPKRIIDKFHGYCNHIDTRTFLKYFNEEDLQTFLMKNIVSEKKGYELARYFGSVQNWSTFLNAMSKSRRIEFINRAFLLKTESDDLGKTVNLLRILKSRTPIYHWYKFYPFELAFSNVKSMIKTETDAIEKSKMLETILLSAKGDLENGKCLLRYFGDKHIHSPMKIKIDFLINFISQIRTHNLDEDSFNILQNIIETLDVYDDGLKKTITESQLVYQILHNKIVPEEMAKLFVFDTLKNLQSKLNSKEKETIFNFLLEIRKKGQSIEIKEFDDFVRCMNSLNGTLMLLKDWDKNVLDYPFVLKTIKQLVKIKQEKVWNVDMSSLYNVQKSWRKHMFYESIILSPTEDAFINSLKHDPNLINLYKNDVESMFTKNDVSLTRLLRKVRIYWPESINKDWKMVYYNYLNQTHGQNAIIRGLCILLPKAELREFINKHAPNDPKLDWDSIEELKLGLQRCLAQYMHNGRPQPHLKTVLAYAKGDYLKYALPSVLAVYYNMSSVQCQELVLEILNTPVSLQKHGLRLLFNKLSSQKIRDSCSALWKSTKNSTIRTEIFKIIYKLLCNETDEVNITQTWGLLESLINDLTFLEDKSIYNLLYEVDQIPQCVKAKFLVSSYKFLKTLMETNEEYEGSEWDLHNLVMYSVKNIDSMPSEFISEVIEDYVKNEFFKDMVYPGCKTKLISSYISCSNTEEEQINKYDAILAPILVQSFKLWNEKIGTKYYIKLNTKMLLFDLIYDLENFNGIKNIIVPVKMFTTVQKLLEQSLPLPENYILIRTWQLATNLVTLFDKNQPTVWEETCIKIAPEFGNICKQYLSEDTTSLFPRIYIIFTKAFENISCLFSEDIKYEICKSFIEKEDFLAGYLAALQFTRLLSDAEKIKDLRDNIRKHTSVEVKMHYYDMFQEDKATLFVI